MICEKKRSAKAKDNMGLVYAMAGKFVKTTAHLEDTPEFSDGCVGLMKAEATFKAKISEVTGKPVKFSTYACVCIYREILRGRQVRSRNREKQLEIPSWFLIEEGDYGELELKEICEVLLSDLEVSDRNKQIFIDYLKHKTQTEVAKMWGLTKERIRQIIFYIVIPRIKKKHANFLAQLELEQGWVVDRC